MVELSCQCPLNIHRTGFILNRINFIQLDIIAHPISRTSFEAVYVTKQCCSICSANVIRFSCAFVESIHSRFQIKRHRFEVEIDWNIKREQLYDDDDNDDSIKSVLVASSCGIYLNVVAHNIDSACTQLQATAHDFPFIIFKYNVKAANSYWTTNICSPTRIINWWHFRFMSNLSFLVPSGYFSAYNPKIAQCCWTYFSIYFQRNDASSQFTCLFSCH